jgi:hypothetical protein
MSTRQRIDGLRELFLVSLCILAGVAASPAQNMPSSVTLRPVDTGRDVLTFNVSRPGLDLGRFAIKTNLVWAIGVQTPNIAVDYGLGGHSSVEAAVGYNGWGNLWDFSKTGPDYDPRNAYKRRLNHFFVKAEYHYWFGEPFEGHFVGGGLFYTNYNAGEVKIPSLFENGSDYYGRALGGGVSYGYLWRFAGRWAAEFSLGVGVAFMSHDKSSIRTQSGPGVEVEEGGYALVDPVSYRKTYLGPTSLGVKLVFMIE